MTLGPAFSTADLLGIALFAANYAFVAPVSAVCVIVCVATRHRRRPTWLIPIACVNLLVVVPQLVLFGMGAEWWFAALLALLALLPLVALAVLVWLKSASERRREDVPDQ